MTLWEVFYTPHTDDETIGMAGAMLKARALGHSVLVILVTDNQPSARGLRLFPEGAFAARREEWTNALQCLKVDDALMWELSEEQMELEPESMQSEVLSRMQQIDNKYDVIHHHTVWGDDDIHIQADDPTLAHVICADAARALRTYHPRSMVSLHGVYVYSHPHRQRNAPIIHHLSAEQWRQKTEALSYFKTGLGYGYASVPELFDGADADPREFVQEVAL